MKMNNKPYYVILTGSKNNAGDFLIKYRAKEIFSKERPDRNIIDINGWEKFSKETLTIVNNAEALILMGGPALQKNMYPHVYPLTDDLNEIKTKIVLMGVGWKSLSGNWVDSINYEFSKSTKKLLNRIKNDGLINSVRDYHSLNALCFNGLERVLMTGCPATYVEDYFPSLLSLDSIKKISFSLGVSFLNSNKMFNQMKNTIELLFVYCKENDVELEVVFHHSTSNNFLKTHGSFDKHLLEHRKFISWLELKGINWVDISGSAERLIEYYSASDIHIGYRVHAHIFMNSISKPSILIAEDGRGKALRRVFGGVVIDGFSEVKQGFISKVIRKLGFDYGYMNTNYAPQEVINSIKYINKSSLVPMKLSRNMINENYEIMRDFLKQLP